MPSRRNAAPGDEGEKVGASGFGDERMNTFWCRSGRSWGSRERGWGRERDGRAMTGWLGARRLGFGGTNVGWARWATRGNGLGGKARCARWATEARGVGREGGLGWLFPFFISSSFLYSLLSNLSTTHNSQ
jgi:hypothetical protein